MTDLIMDFLWEIHDRIGRAVVMQGSDYSGQSAESIAIIYLAS
jgi:hypothetical protein